MKTNMIKTAALTLTMVISLSVNAQNTKSLKENRITQKLDKIVKENTIDFANALDNLKEAIQFKPTTLSDYTGEVSESAIDLNELKSFVKYVPSTNVEVSITSQNNEMESVLAELQEFVKFKPHNESTLIESEIKKATEELALVVRFKPAS